MPVYACVFMHIHVCVSICGYIIHVCALCMDCVYCTCMCVCVQKEELLTAGQLQDKNEKDDLENELYDLRDEVSTDRQGGNSLLARTALGWTFPP